MNLNFVLMRITVTYISIERKMRGIIHSGNWEPVSPWYYKWNQTRPDIIEPRAGSGYGIKGSTCGAVDSGVYPTWIRVADWAILYVLFWVSRSLWYEQGLLHPTHDTNTTFNHWSRTNDSLILPTPHPDFVRRISFSSGLWRPDKRRINILPESGIF